MFGFLFSEAACDVLKGFPSLSVISAYLGGNWYLALGKLFGKNLLCESRNTKTCLWERGKEQLITRTRNHCYIHLTDVIWCTYDWSDQLMINNIQFKKPLNAQTSLCFCWWYLSTCKTISHQQSPFVILGGFHAQICTQRGRYTVISLVRTSLHWSHSSAQGKQVCCM